MKNSTDTFQTSRFWSLQFILLINKPKNIHDRESNSESDLQFMSECPTTELAQAISHLAADYADFTELKSRHFN